MDELLRVLSKPRGVAIYKDQEERMEMLSKKLGREIPFSKIVREGVDRVLSDLEGRVCNA